jgi:hypothetical protein
VQLARRRRFLRLRFADAGVVDQHLLREDRGVVGVAWPLAADRQIQDEEESMVEDPGVALGVGWTLRREVVAIDVTADGVGFLHDGKDMVIVSPVRPRVAGPVDGAVSLFAPAIMLRLLAAHRGSRSTRADERRDREPTEALVPHCGKSPGAGLSKARRPLAHGARAAKTRVTSAGSMGTDNLGHFKHIQHRDHSHAWLGPCRTFDV